VRMLSQPRTELRSTRWTSSLAPEARYELRDCDDMILGVSESRAEAIRMLQAFVLTSPGREDEVFLVSLTANGRVVAREDLFDLEFG
jgi:hypothetical protein